MEPYTIQNSLPGDFEHHSLFQLFLHYHAQAFDQFSNTLTKLNSKDEFYFEHSGGFCLSIKDGKWELTHVGGGLSGYTPISDLHCAKPVTKGSQDVVERISRFKDKNNLFHNEH